MTRKQRLSALIAALSLPQPSTLATLAARLHRPETLVAHDLNDLVAAGYPVEGDPDAGYQILRLVLLPTLTLTEAQLNALRVAVASLRADEGTDLMRLLDLAQPDYFPGIDLDTLTSDVPGFGMAASARHLPVLRRALRLQRWTVIRYADAEGTVSVRRLHPLGLERWGAAWALVAWCMRRHDFRTFRLDRIQTVKVSDRTAPHRLGRDLATFRALHRRDDGAALA